MASRDCLPSTVGRPLQSLRGTPGSKIRRKKMCLLDFMNGSVASRRVGFRWSSGRPLSDRCEKTNSKMSLQTDLPENGMDYLWSYEPPNPWQWEPSWRNPCEQYHGRALDSVTFEIRDSTSLEEDRRGKSGVCGRHP